VSLWEHKSTFFSSTQQKNTSIDCQLARNESTHLSLVVVSPTLSYSEQELEEQERCRLRQTAQTVQFQTRNLQQNTEKHGQNCKVVG